MSDLSPDELTVLLIAAGGEPIIPIGRWKPAVESLVQKKLLARHPHAGDPDGFFNNVITAAGKAEAERQDTIYDQQLGDVILQSRSIGHQHTKLREQAERIAVMLVKLAEDSAAVTGDDKAVAWERWAKVIGQRALELLK